MSRSLGVPRSRPGGGGKEKIPIPDGDRISVLQPIVTTLTEPFRRNLGVI
jgi:hypothetical protein